MTDPEMTFSSDGRETHPGGSSSHGMLDPASADIVDDDPVPDYAEMLRLHGHTIVVLGAGLGIGRQSAHALASVGATVVCVDLDEDRATPA